MENNEVLEVTENLEEVTKATKKFSVKDGIVLGAVIYLGYKGGKAVVNFVNKKVVKPIGEKIKANKEAKKASKVEETKSE